jgi:hypothetical protein
MFDKRHVVFPAVLLGKLNQSSIAQHGLLGDAYQQFKAPILPRGESCTRMSDPWNNNVRFQKRVDLEIADASTCIAFAKHDSEKQEISNGNCNRCSL